MKDSFNLELLPTCDEFKGYTTIQTEALKYTFLILTLKNVQSQIV